LIVVRNADAFPWQPPGELDEEVELGPAELTIEKTLPKEHRVAA
jgi:hypothetical protein